MEKLKNKKQKQMRARAGPDLAQEKGDQMHGNKH